MIDQYVVPVIGAQIIRFIFDQKATARCFLARILWLQGFPDQARRTAYDIVDAALASGDTLSLCQSLVQAGCPVAIFVGDAEQLEKFVGILLDHSTRNGLEFWQAWGRCFAGVLSIKRGEVAEGLSRLNAALVELRAIEYGVYYIVFLGEYAEGLGRIGRAADGLVAIREAIARSERNEENWCRAELLRIEGELLLIDAGAGASAAAETQFRQAIDLARAQRTPAWELRTAISLARLRQSEGRMAEGRAILAPAFDRFTEGHSAGDLRAARSLLRELEAGIPAGPP
jgi:predicted ATPase